MWVDRTQTNGNFAGTAITVDKPGGTVLNDVIYVWVVHSSGSISAPDGTWTKHLEVIVPTSATIMSLFTKVAGGSEPSTYAFTNSASAGSVYVANAAGGGSGSVQILSSGEAAGGSTVYGTPAADTLANDSLVLAGIGVNSNTDHRPITADTSPAATMVGTGYETGELLHLGVQRYEKATAGSISLDFTVINAVPVALALGAVALLPTGVTYGTVTVDNFNRANQTGLGTPSGGGTWGTDFGSSTPALIDIVSNQAKNPAAPGDYKATFHSQSLPANCYAGYKVANATSVAVPALVTSGVGTTNRTGYEIDWNQATGSWGLYKLNPGAGDNNLQNGNTAYPAVGNLVRIRLTVTSVIVEYSTDGGVNWINVVTNNDTTYRSASTKAGFALEGGAAFDEFFVGPVVSGGGGGALTWHGKGTP